ncbi:MAG: ankyrin repeat domain-containing protein [Vulcanimicrobiota bacterium]
MAETYRTIETGEILRGRFRIAEILGSGAYGVVYRVQDMENEGVQWAIKEIWEGSLSDDERQEALTRFNHEAALLRSLNHTGIPKVIDFFSIGPCHYIVMEYIEGKTLESLMKEKPLDEHVVIRWAIKICDILDYLHNLKPEPVIFRDLKPDNIMVNPKGRVLLIDFGTARYFNPVKVRDTIALGTPGFSPPEQYGAAQSDTRSDIYALGATIYHLLTGADLESMNFKFPPLRNYNRDFSPVLEKALARSLEADREKRFTDVGEFRRVLKSALDTKLPPIRPTAPVIPASPAVVPGLSSGSPGPSPRNHIKTIHIIIGMIVFITILLSQFFSKTAREPARKYDSMTLYNAIEKKDLKEVSAVLSQDRNLASSEYDTGAFAIHHAVNTGNLDIVRVLVEHGADVNARERQNRAVPLYSASYCGYIDIAAYLLAMGAKVNMKTGQGYTPLGAAVHQGHKDMVELLIAKKADTNVETENGNSPLAIALANKHWDIAKLLIDGGADPNRLNRDRMLPLNYAVMRDSPEEIVFLLSQGARIEEREQRNHLTALMQAVWFGNVKAMEVLIKNGGDVNATDDKGRTSLHLAALKNRPEAIAILAKNGAKVNFAEWDDGWRPLHSAADSGSLDAAKMLVACGADVNGKDKAGKTPRELAQNQGQAALASYLKDIGGK